MTQLTIALRAIATEAIRKADLYAKQGRNESCHVMRGVADAVLAGVETLHTPDARTDRISALRSGTDPSIASRTELYGVKLSDMNDEEIRIAAYWLAMRYQRSESVTRARFEQECG